MLDALKFAFEILIVGALALPWLAILSPMLEAVGPSATLPAFLNFIPDAARTTVTVAMVIAFGYVVGSVVSRTSRDLFDDELPRPLPCPVQRSTARRIGTHPVGSRRIAGHLQPISTVLDSSRQRL